MSAKRDTPLEIVTREPAVEHRPVPVEEGGEKTLRTYLDVVVDSRWLIAGTVVVAAALAVLYVVLATPQYKSDVLIQVEDRKAGNNFLAELSGMLAESSPAETEIEIIRSRGMMAAVVRELRLDVVVSVKRFPLVGAAVARRHRGSDVTGAFLGQSYGWGGERVSVGTLEVPPELMGRRLTLVAGDAGRFTLQDPEGRELLSGVVGTPASGGGAQISITELRAHAGTEIALVRRHFDDVVSELQREIRVAEKGRKTGVLELSLSGNSAVQTAAILDALSRAYVRQNVDRRSAEAEKTLTFLRTQLPTLRNDVDSAEAELEAYRARRGTVDVSLEAQSAIHRAADIEKALAELRVEAAGLRERFTEEHPSYLAVVQKIRRLETVRAGLEARFRKLPESELQSARRLRDVKVANELYLAVLNKAQELRVVKEGTIGNVRVLDAAVVPIRPVSPKVVQSLTVGIVLGLLAGVLAAFARWSFADGVEDPDEVERGTGLPVSASVPHSAAQFEAERLAGGDRKLVPLLAGSDPKDLAVESLRSLRTSLQFALHEARNNIVVICGPAPGVGKSFVAANLAHLLGEAGKRVLVVDADLRRGQLHHHFGVADRGTGLSDAIIGQVAVSDAVRPTHSPNVSVLTTGHIPSNPAELVGSERFHRVLTEIASRYEVVLVDSPPVLAVTDAALIARHAGVSLLVLRAGKHPLREIGASLRQLGQNGVRVHGIVVNDVRLDRGLGRRSAYHYQYKYE